MRGVILFGLLVTGVARAGPTMTLGEKVRRADRILVVDFTVGGAVPEGHDLWGYGLPGAIVERARRSAKVVEVIHGPADGALPGSGLLPMKPHCLVTVWRGPKRIRRLVFMAGDRALFGTETSYGDDSDLAPDWPKRLAAVRAAAKWKGSSGAQAEARAATRGSDPLLAAIAAGWLLPGEDRADGETLWPLLAGEGAPGGPSRCRVKRGG